MQPIHVAFALLNENTGSENPVPGAHLANAGTGTTLFASVISRIGGDPVSNPTRTTVSQR